MTFAVNDRVLSKIISGQDTDKWIMCVIEKVNKDGTYRLRVENPEEYNTFTFADSVHGSLLRKAAKSCMPPCLPGGGQGIDVNERHILLKIPRERGGVWDKVGWYWAKHPDTMRLVRAAAVKKVRASFKKYDTEVKNYDWNLTDIKADGFNGIYGRKNEKNARMYWKLTYSLPPRKDIPIYELYKKTAFDNYQRALSNTRYDFELIDVWTEEEKGEPDIRIQIVFEKVRFPLISDRYATGIIAFKENKAGFVRMEASIKHPLKKDITSLAKSRFLNFDEHRLQEDGTLKNVAFIDLDIGGMVPISLVNVCFPRMLSAYSIYLKQFKEFDFTKDKDWNRFYETIGSTDKR